MYRNRRTRETKAEDSTGRLFHRGAEALLAAKRHYCKNGQYVVFGHEGVSKNIKKIF